MEKSSVAIMANAYAVCCEQELAKKTTNQVVFDTLCALHGSFGLPMYTGTEGEDFIVETALAFERSGGTILAPHAYRGTPFHRRSSQENNIALDKVFSIAEAIHTKKQAPTIQVMNMGTYYDFNGSTALSVEEFIKLFDYTLDGIHDHAEMFEWVHLEAANNIHEVVAVAHLCEQRDLSLRVCFKGMYHPSKGLIFHDPVYGEMCHLEAMELVDKKTDAYVTSFGGNCGDERAGYDIFLQRIQDTSYAKKYTTVYRNEARVAGENINNGGHFVSYSDIPGELSHSAYATQLLKQYALDIIGICCGNTPIINKKFVSQLHDNGYSTNNTHLVSSRSHE